MAAAALLVAAACGGDGEDAAEDTTTTEAPVEETVPSEDDAEEVDVAPAAWEQVAVDVETPPARAAAVLASSPDGTLWLHGGSVDGQALDDLWRFDGERWERVGIEGPAPEARFEHVGVWDDDRDRLVVAMGQDTDFNVFDDVWAFDPAAGTWSQLAGGGPAARYGACVVVDGDGRMVVSHGFSTQERFADTWAFDLATDSWADVTPAEGPRPVARCLHACAWDAEAEALVLFGGRTDEVRFVDDTWRLGPDGWQELPATGPSARVHARGMYVDDAVHLLGGEGPDGLAADAWMIGDGEWRPGPEGAPAARHSHAVAERDGQAWVFGGRGDAGDLADLWRFG